MADRRDREGTAAGAQAEARLVGDAVPGLAENDEAPPTLDSVTGYLLRRAHYLYQTYWLLHFPAGETLTPMQSGMLTLLRQRPDMTQTELARRMGVEVPTAFKAVKGLEKWGYLERVADRPDKRARSLRLTVEGARMLKAIDRFNPIRDSNLLADLSPAERLQFTQMLARVILRGTEHLGMSQDVVVSVAADAGPSVLAIAQRLAQGGEPQVTPDDSESRLAEPDQPWRPPI